MPCDIALITSWHTVKAIPSGSKSSIKATALALLPPLLLLGCIALAIASDTLGIADSNKLC